MFSAVKPPWHGIGTVTKGTLKASEAIQTAKLDWGVRKEDIYRFQEFDPINLKPEQRELIEKLRQANIPFHLGNIRPINAYALTIREDLPFNDPASDLGIVGADYATIGNLAAFDLCDRLVGGVGAKYETAGSLMNGKRVFLTARMPKTVKIGDDELTPFLFATTAHDGTEALVVAFSLIRIVCWNTLSMAMAETQFAKTRVRHSAGNLTAEGRVRQVVVDSVRTGIHEKVAENAAKSDNVSTEFASVATEWLRTQSGIFTQLADYRVTDQFVSDYLTVLFPPPIQGRDTRAVNKQQAIADVYYGTQPGNDQKVMKETAYRLFNAVTHYSDHIVNPRQTTLKATGEKKTYAEARLNRILDGGLRTSALDILCEAVDSKGESLRAAVSKHKAEREIALRRELVTN
jgi:phage/plasmid-like protein (TIGR03299 family)